MTKMIDQIYRYFQCLDEKEALEKREDDKGSGAVKKVVDYLYMGFRYG